MAPRLVLRAILNPLVNLTVIGALVAMIGVAPEAGQLYLFGVVLLPCVLVVLLLLNLPFMGAALRWFRLPEATRRNHTLEHATLLVLRYHTEDPRKMSGRSDQNGFRIAGASGPRAIRGAFEEATDRLKSGDRNFAVSHKCGSMIVTTQAIGLFVFTFTGIVFLVAPPNAALVLITVLGELAFIVVLRYPLGAYIQRRRFLSFRFSEPQILSITPVHRAELLERHPVFYVKTSVVSASDSLHAT